MRLTRKYIEERRAAVARAGKEAVCFDDGLPGFGIRLKPSGAMTWTLQYRCKNGVSRRVKLGAYEVFGYEAARKEAKRLLGAVARGEDPATERKTGRHAQGMNDFLDQFLERHAARRKERSASEYARLVNQCIRPSLGSLKVAAVTRRDIVRLHHSLQNTPYQANRVVAVLSKAMNVAEAWGIRPDGTNPCRHVEKYRETKRERFLSSEELAALGLALTQAKALPGANPYPIAAIQLLAFTGARLNEILTAKWEWIDYERKALCLPDSKTGQKILQLPAPALEVLSTLYRVEGNPYIIVGQQAGQHLVNLQKTWRQIREQATIQLWATHMDKRIADLIDDLTHKHRRTPTKNECVSAAEVAEIRLPIGLLNLRLHDLRHGFASVGASGGMSLPILGALLGHTQPATTARYAHLSADPKQEAANRIAGQIKAAMAGNGSRVTATGKK